jgi:hypothetical protein
MRRLLAALAAAALLVMPARAADGVIAVKSPHNAKAIAA